MSDPHCHPLDGCITCGDTAVRMRVERLGADGLAVCVDADGGHEDVALDLVPDAGVGDLVMVHARTAIGRVGEEAAA